jgi:hypothetical protein
MSRIICRTPSTGKSNNYIYRDVLTTFVQLAEAPDFSVPDPSGSLGEDFSVDPADNSRAIRPGELFFLTPLAARNKSNEIRWIEVQILFEDSESIVLAKFQVPPDDTAFIPLQGRSLFKRDSTGVSGDRLLVRAETSNTFDVWVTGEEKLSAEHIGIERGL